MIASMTAKLGALPWATQVCYLPHETKHLEASNSRLTVSNHPLTRSSGYITIWSFGMDVKANLEATHKHLNAAVEIALCFIAH